MKASVRLCCSALFTLFLSFNVLAQSDVPGAQTSAGNGGLNNIQGDIIAPDGKRLDRPVMVRLSTMRGELSTTSNGNGSFRFGQLTGGRYIVTIDAGEGYASATETVEIPHSGGGMSRIGGSYSVQMYLRAKEKFARLGVSVFMSLDLDEYQAQLDSALSWLLSVADPRELSPPQIVPPKIRLLATIDEFD